MSGKIRVLSQEVVGLIAAGEVVERPASCVKELVENSLDAGASAVTVSLDGGGLYLIRVTDNGSGIAPEDLRMVFAPHATSKLSQAEDLHSIRTLGFRGEALASIARVSKVTLLTRLKGSEAGMKAVNEGGEMLSIKEAACAEGTQITVRDLFFNAPVRRDFMDRPQREAALCAELLEHLILSRPDIAFRLISDGKQVYVSPGDGRLEGAVLSVYGADTLKALKKADAVQGGVVITGLVGIGEQARGNRAHQHFFLNGRAVRSEALSRAVEEGTRHRVMIGRFPMCALSLTLPYDKVDVNVHPNKWEVRFLNQQDIMKAVRQAVEDAVNDAPLDSPPPLFSIPQAPPQTRVMRAETEPLKEQETFRPALVARDVASSQPLTAHQTLETVEKSEQMPAPGVPQAGMALKVIGTAFNTYIIALQGDRLLLIDQHALHERILFDRLMEAAVNSAPAQTLLSPSVIQLDYPAYQAYLAYREDLARAGFEAEEFGPRTIRLLSVPLNLGEPAAERCFLDALDELRTQGSVSGQSRTVRIMMAACKQAVKGGEALPDGALQSLVDRMVESGTTPSCPHGRPIVLELTRTELERRFSRIQK